MKRQPDLEFQRLLENIKSHFGFLFQRGYQISSALFTGPHNENWNVILAGDNCLIKIHYREEKLHLSLCSAQLFGQTGMFDLHDLVHWMNHESRLPTRRKSPPDETEQFTTTAWLLEKHIDDILILFQKIHLGIAFDRAGQLSIDNPPVFFFYESNEAAYVAPA